MNKLFPISLFGRLAAVVVAAFIILHVLTSLTLTGFVERQAARSALLDQAGVLALCFRLLDAEPTGQNALGRRLERVDAMRVRLTDAPPLTQSRDELSLVLHKSLADSLANLSGKSVPPDHLITNVSVHVPDRDGDGHTSLHEKREAVLNGARLYTSQASFLLHDGTWATIEHKNSPPEGSVYNLSLLVLGGEAALMILLVLLVVHHMVRPLRALARAAENFSQDMDASRPLAETGPHEIREAARAFNRMRRRIGDIMGERARMLAAVSHDLRTPLTRMRLRMEKAQPLSLRGKLLGDLDALQSIVTTSAELARCESTPEKAVPTDMDAFLESIVEDRLDMGQRVRLQGSAPKPFPLRAGALRRCLDNLLDNALRYGGGALLEVARSGDTLSIRVLDEGPGIPESMLTRVFEPFYRLEPSRSRSTGGVGLGLTIARALAGLNRGELILSNRPEGGLCAEIRLTYPNGAANGARSDP